MDRKDLKGKTCCFTGHRDLPAHKTERIAKRTEEEIRRLIVDEGICFFGVGGAIGYDTLVAEVLFQLREREFPDIKVILVYPFEGFANGWTPEQKAVYNKLLPKYDKTVCVSSRPCREAYFARNRHLVDNSAYCISYCIRRYGGTAYTVQYAKRKGLELRNVDG